MNFCHEFFCFSHHIRKAITTIFLGVIVFSFSACTTIDPDQQGGPSEPSIAPPPPVTQVFFYPNSGQNKSQQDRDQYECSLWATQQTGFDPSQPNLAPHHRLRIVPQPAVEHDTVLGAATGAIIGAVIGAPFKRGEGAVIGAVAGAMLGAASDSARNEQIQRRQQRYDQETTAQYADTERKAGNYRRALGACLEGRNYTVR